MKEIAMTDQNEPFNGTNCLGRHAVTAPRQPAANSVRTEKQVEGGTVRPRRKRAFRFLPRVVKLLQQILPATLPVVVHLGSPGPECFGFCRIRKSHFQICISRDLSEGHAIDVLMHEWAHALAWPREDDFSASLRLPPAQHQKPFHGAEWGQAYAEVFCVVHFDIAPRLQRALQAAQRKSRRRRGGKK